MLDKVTITSCANIFSIITQNWSWRIVNFHNSISSFSQRHAFFQNHKMYSINIGQSRWVFCADWSTRSLDARLWSWCHNDVFVMSFYELCHRLSLILSRTISLIIISFEFAMFLCIFLRLFAQECWDDS